MINKLASRPHLTFLLTAHYSHRITEVSFNGDSHSHHHQHLSTNGKITLAAVFDCETCKQLIRTYNTELVEELNSLSDQELVNFFSQNVQEVLVDEIIRLRCLHDPEERRRLDNEIMKEVLAITKGECT